MSRRCAVAILCLAALSRPGSAGATAAADPTRVLDDVPPGQSKFRVFTGSDGLRNLAITNIVQDRDGFLWLSTDDGVYRFDGERFAHFTLADGLVSNMFVVVGVGPDGRVCAGSDRGLACWDGGRFSQTRTRGLPAIAVRTMVSFAGKLWVGTAAGLYVQNDAGWFVPAPGWPGPPSATVGALWADADGLVAGDGPTVRLTSGDGAWRGIGEVGLGDERVEGVLRDREAALWIRTPKRIWRLPRGASLATELRDAPTGYYAAGAPIGMAIGPRGDVLVATDLGIAYRDHDRWRMIDRSVGLPASGARTLFVDREGTLWIGAAGLVQLRGRGVVERHDEISGLPGDTAWSYQRDRDGTLWVGTSRCLARAIAGRWVCLPGTEGRIVRSFVFPPQGGVFLGGAPSDLLYIGPDGRASSLGDDGRSADGSILALALGPNGDLWIATKSGLYRLPGAVPGPIEHVVIPGTRPDDRFASLAVVGEQLWTVTAEGVAVNDRGGWHRFDKTAGFRASAMHYVIARADRRLCVAYSEPIGLSCFRYDGRAISELEHIAEADGLTSGMIYFLGEDRQQRLWVGTGDGVDVVTPGGIDHFDERDGLAGNDSAAMAFLVDRDGSLWLGATGGASHILAQFYAGPPTPPRTALLDGRLGDRPIGDARAALEVPHDRGALTLEFAASSMLDDKRVGYEIRLSPLETAWNLTHQREARFPGLLPGAYRFEVRARVGAGTWGPATVLGFTVLPAWWQTGWLLILIGLVGAVAIAAGLAWWVRRRTRRLHEQSDASFRAVLDLMPDLISVHRDRKLIYLNLANRRFLGFDRPGARWAGVELIDRVHPDDREQVAELFARVRSLPPQHSSEVVELRMRSADDSWRTCEVSGVLVDLGGALTVVASGRDVTDRKRLRAKLLVSDRMASLGTLAAGIAHEINNPLSYVTGNLEAVAETLRATAASPSVVVGAEHAEVTAAISDARDGAERVRKIVQGLRLFSRPEDEQRVPLAMAGVLEAAIRLTSNEIRHRAQLVRELGPVPLVAADDSRLTQVFINLLVNAAHAIPEGHSDENRITVRTRTDDQGRAVIEVEDTGTGIAPDVVSRVFDPFFTTKNVGSGTGLGLSICHGIITSLGGQISIASTAGPATSPGPPSSAPRHREDLAGVSGRIPRVGTVVRVVLPAAAELPAALPTAVVDGAPVAVAAGHRRRVLLVDDEPLVAHTMERLLRRDYDITIALCGHDALDHITRGVRFDAIITDVMMPNMTGIELLEELHRTAPDQAQRLIFLSGGAFTAHTRERLDQLGQLGVVQLEKPVTGKQLRACVQQIVNAELPETRTPGMARRISSAR